MMAGVSLPLADNPPQRDRDSVPSGTQRPAFSVALADYGNPTHAQAVVDVLDAYARDPAGGGRGLVAEVKQGLIAAMARRPDAFSVLAWDESEAGSPRAIGLINCFEGFSTFVARPLVNVHDVAVLRAYRGQGVARAMLALVEQEARRRGACKLTLEVLDGNQPAMRLYQREGFAPYALDPAWGTAVMMQKKL